MSDGGPQLGAIEGFYGEPWSVDSRLAMAEWLPALGLGSYLYAPKRDRFLRRAWRDPWPSAARRPLRQLARRCEETGLRLGVGLSPFALYQQYDDCGRRALRERIEQINDLGAPLLALLFDDMPGDCAGLAAKQGAIVDDVRRWSCAEQVLVCPTYYSDDPVLDRVFGARPLPARCSLFWTGREVCSERIAAADLPSEERRGGCRLALWDNYPVNDSRARSGHLYTAPLAHRDRALAAAVDWHFCNAMNQPALSLPALGSLAAVYGRYAPEARAAMEDAGLSRELLRACEPLASRTLDDLAAPEREGLERCARRPTVAAGELAAFLAGAYAFDPACLTD